MRRKRLGLILVLSLVSGGLAAFLSFQYLGQRVEPVLRRDEVSKAKVVVAARDLPLGAVVRAEDVRLVAWPEDAVPAGYYSSLEGVVGHGLVAPVRRNEPLLQGKLADPRAGGGLPVAIPEGMRAVSVKVDEVIGVAGFVLPGTRVDVLVSVRDPDGNRAPRSRLVLQNVETLAAGQSIERTTDGEPRSVPVVTLLVTPEQAEVLTLAATEGRIQLALRNTMDTDSVPTPGARVDDLIHGARRTAPTVRGAAPPRPGIAIELYTGGKRTVTKF